MTVIPFGRAAAAALSLVAGIGVIAFVWPFFASPEFVSSHGNDTPWLFAGILALLTLVALAEVTAGRLDAKTIAVLGVTAAAGGAMRVLSAGTAGLEPMFFVVIVAGRVLGPGVGFVSGALALLTGALLTGGVGPWLPFQMICAGGVGLGAGLLRVRSGARFGVRVAVRAAVHARVGGIRAGVPRSAAAAASCEGKEGRNEEDRDPRGVRLMDGSHGFPSPLTGP